MRVRWTTDAADDLERICDFIAKDRPESARRVAETIVQGVGALDTFPERGRRGRVEGTRELVFASLPFVAVYEVLDQVQPRTRNYAARRRPSSRASQQPMRFQLEKVRVTSIPNLLIQFM